MGRSTLVETDGEKVVGNVQADAGSSLESWVSSHRRSYTDRREQGPQRSEATPEVPVWRVEVRRHPSGFREMAGHSANPIDVDGESGF